jgi:hypothetical protein
MRKDRSHNNQLIGNGQYAGGGVISGHSVILGLKTLSLWDEFSASLMTTLSELVRLDESADKQT